MSMIDMIVDASDNHLYAIEGSLCLGRERLATDPDDRDLTGTFRMFGLNTAVAPGEWPNKHEGVTTGEDPRHQG